MRKLFFALLPAFPLSLVAQSAKFKKDVDRTIGERLMLRYAESFMEYIHFTGCKFKLLFVKNINNE
jgi:hypothetical protein